MTLNDFKRYFPEYLWLTVAVFGAAEAVHATIKYGMIRDTFIFYIIVVVSIVMYFFRRRLRMGKSD